MKNEGLNVKQKQIIPIAAFTANSDLQKLKTALNEGLDAGLTVNEIKEILVQMYAYAGFPRSLKGIDARHVFYMVGVETDAVRCVRQPAYGVCGVTGDYRVEHRVYSL